MSYPCRPVLDVLPQFVGDAKKRGQTSERERLDDFVAERYRAGYSLRQIGELTGRSQGAIRQSLDRTRTPRRGRGAQRLETASAGSPPDL